MKLDEPEFFGAEQVKTCSIPETIEMELKN
jgi:hypothetical protein